MNLFVLTPSKIVNAQLTFPRGFLFEDPSRARQQNTKIYRARLGSNP